MKPVVYLNSHPIQYFAPLYKQIAEETNIDLEVLYCSDESIQGKKDKGFGTNVKWDIPLLSGYRSVFLKNRAVKPSIHNGFWGLFNPGIIRYLHNKPSSILIIHGWAYSTHIIAIVAGKFLGHTVCLRAETPQNQEVLKNKFITLIKHFYLRFIFLFVDGFLYVGTQNKLFYKGLNVSDDKLVFTPYSVDNIRFRDFFKQVNKEQARAKLKLPLDAKIILYSGKYIEKKNPLDIIKAFNLLNDKNALLIMVGDGELRTEMESLIYKHSLNDSVILTGFINQSLIPLYYSVADVFVMCSGLGETWGLSVNEAMNFGLPIIVSDICGCSYDLVKNNINGRVFETGNIDQLSEAVKYFLNINDSEKAIVAHKSLEIMDQYSYNEIIRSIINIGVNG